ncbi:MAG: hypothetical protein ACRD9R_00545 [Pyrinomonadaceae bacterium]
MGIVNDKSSHLTEAENFIFTDLDMKVEEILKANPSTPLSISESVTVTRDGGAVTLNGRTFRASRDDFEPMLVGKRYLLFLRLVPETGSYLAYGNGSFQLEENTVSPLGEGARQEIFHGELKESKTFMDEIRALTANGCEKK